MYSVRKLLKGTMLLSASSGSPLALCLETLVEIVETQLPHGIPPPGQSSRSTEADLPGPRQCDFSRWPFTLRLTWLAALGLPRRSPY
jgi:hypothetical protein